MAESIKKGIVWFRNDLRLHDNEALRDALSHLHEIIPIYVFDERMFNGVTSFGFPKTGAFRAQFIIESVRNLRKNLRSRGSELLVRIGKPEEIIAELAGKEKTSWVFCNRERTPEEVFVQDTLEENLWSIGQEVRYSRGKMLYYTSDLPFPVTHTPDTFSGFRKEVEKYTPIRQPLPIPEFLGKWMFEMESGDIPELSDFNLSLVESKKNEIIPGGETAALKRVDYYFSDKKLASNYFNTRNDSFGNDFSTKFSAYLAQGCVSPKYLYQQLKTYENKYGSNKSTYWIYFELLWRDFFRLIAKKYKEQIFLIDGIKGTSFTENREDWKLFEKWKNGETGYPFIDANMRQLKETGFMSNRGRQNVASFLVHDLGLNWLMGAEYFESQLVDYDPCSNYGNWNYLAGVGCDPRDYRKFNVLLQSRKYDPEAKFIKHWCPELAQLSDKQIHVPFELSELELLANNIVLGKDYPEPIVQHSV
jgi:deoxyribodipyrimidine photo-lyase